MLLQPQREISLQRQTSEELTADGRNRKQTGRGKVQTPQSIPREPSARALTSVLKA